MFNNLNILFLMMMIFSSIFSISSTNWLSVWMGLELNMLSFVPILIEVKNISSNESAIKYFLIQSSASAMFLMACLLNSFNTAIFSNMNIFFYTNIFIILPLLIKLGSAPFQAWFILIMEGLSWLKCFLVSTWQKITPLFILSYMNINNNLLYYFAILSFFVGSIGGLNQTSLRKILAYSSINHMGWMLISLTLNNYLLTIYFIFYMFVNLMVFLNMNMNYIYQFNQNFSKFSLLSFLISLLSLGGLPPFLGFLPKWFIIQNLCFSNMFMICFIMIMTTLITLFYYLRLTYKMLLLSSSIQTWTINFNKYSNNVINSMTFLITISGLISYNLFLT